MSTVHCPRCSSPLLSPEEPCQKCLQQKKPRSRTRRIFLFLLPTAFIISLLLACIGILARNYLYASYQPAHCTITSKQILPVHLQSNLILYEPSLTYQVSRSNGQQEMVTGYKGPWFDGWGDRYPFMDDAQHILQPYTIGQTYPCWYTPLKSPDTVLSLANYPGWAMNRSFWLTLLSEGVIFFILSIVWSSLWELSTLARRGISTQGIFVSETRLILSGQDHTRPIVEFSTLTDSSVTYQTTSNGILFPLKVGEKTSVIYDPKNPAGNSFAGQRVGLLLYPIIFSLLGLIILALALFLEYALWLL